MQAVIMAGGKGTRLFSITNDEIPKAMAPLMAKPILEHQLNALRRNGITEIIIVIGHLGEKIREYFGDGSAFGVHIRYITEDKPLGTGGSLYYLKEHITDDFLLFFGDIIFDINTRLMADFHKRKKAKVTLFTHPNSHPYDSDLVVADDDDRVLCFDSKHNIRDYDYDNCVNAGIYVFSPSVFNHVPKPVKTDLDKDIIGKLIETGCVYAYSSTEYVKDVGTPERLSQTEKAIGRGTVASKNLTLPQKCIFLDRDGTLNKYIGLLYEPSQLELESSVIEALALINASDYLAIVVTNQPVVARGLCDIDTVHEIHKKLQTLLGKAHVYLDDILFCPHHPDKGYSEENPAYKIPCKCRKPKTGMIDIAKELYNIDLGSSWMVGDTTTDIMTGKSAGLKTVLLKTGEAGNDGKYDVTPDYTADNPLDAVNYILGGSYD